MLDPEEGLTFTVTDLKQYTYCPRIVFYTYCLPLVRPTTYKMESGAAAHEKAGKQEQRRTLAAYGLTSGERHFDVQVASEKLGLRGKVDMIIAVGEAGHREWIPVDYKQSARQVGRHVRLQLAAYGLMLEEMLGGVARRGFVYSLLTRKTEEIGLTKRLRDEVCEIVLATREMVQREAMPDAPKSHRQCVNCEFHRFCNDVL